MHLTFRMGYRYSPLLMLIKHGNIIADDTLNT